MRLVSNIVDVCLNLQMLDIVRLSLVTRSSPAPLLPSPYHLIAYSLSELMSVQKG